MTQLFSQNKVPENIKEATADTSEAHHIYRNFLRSRLVEEWMDMIRDAQKRMAPQQFYFRYLMGTYQGVEANRDLADPTLHKNRGPGIKDAKITDMWTLNVSSAFFDEVGAAVERNDWSIATWEDFYDRCQTEAVRYEDSNGFFRDFQQTPQYIKFVEAKLMSIINRNKSGVYQLLGLNPRLHGGVIHNFAFPQMLRYGSTAAYLEKKGAVSHHHSKQMARIAYNGIATVQTIPFTFDEFIERIAHLSL